MVIHYLSNFFKTSVDYYCKTVYHNKKKKMKIIFYRIPKNASTSIYDHLGNINLIKENESLIEGFGDKRLYKNNLFSSTHLKPDELKIILGPIIERYFSFCVVRNPWDRMVSTYKFSEKYNLHKHYGLDNHPSFSYFCELIEKNANDPFILSAHKQVQWTNGNCKPKKIIKFENLQEDFSKMIKKQNLSDIVGVLPHENKTEHDHYSAYYDAKTKDIVARVFKEDIKAFNYDFSSQDLSPLKKEKPKGVLRRR